MIGRVKRGGERNTRERGRPDMDVGDYTVFIKPVHNRYRTTNNDNLTMHEVEML